MYNNIFSVAPQIVSLSSDVDFNIAYFGDDVTLMCSSDGGPDNNYEWSKDGVVLSGETSANLTLSFITATSGGDYICSVSNAAGNDSASTTLYVAPYIVTPLEEQFLTTNGSNINTSCDAAGFPNPTVYWVNMTDNVVANSSFLNFNPVMFGDEGVYRCVATADIDGLVFNATNEATIVGKFQI